MILPIWYISTLIWVFLLPPSYYNQVDEYTLKTIFIERFTRFIEWPDESDDSKTNFSIAVLGENPFGKKLEEAYSVRKIKNRKVSIRYIDEMYDISGCDLLFIASSEKEKITRIVEYIKDKPILTIGDTGGFAEKGIHINFYLKDNNIHFEMNENAVKKSKLMVNHLLFTMARIVNTGK